MRTWLKWFRGLSKVGKYSVFGTIIGVIGLMLSIVSLPMFRGDNPDSSSSDQRLVSQPVSALATEKQATAQTAFGSGNTQIGAIENARDIIINPEPKVDISAVLEHENKQYEISIYKLITTPNPVGVRPTITRPQISVRFSATKPVITFDETKKLYFVEITRYIADPDTDGGKRLEKEVLESDQKFGEPKYSEVTR